MTAAELSAIVERKLAAYWPAPAERRRARAQLPAMQVDPMDRAHRERVHLAILKLSGGSLAELTKYAAAAGTDWRDVLMWAENGEEYEAWKRS